MSQDLKRAIVTTISYSDQFDYPLSFNQLSNRLIGVLSDEQSVILHSKQLVKLGILENKAQEICLKGNSHKFQIKKNREDNAVKKRVELGQFLKLVIFLPWIKAIFLTGSVTQNNATDNDDLDFMIVTQARRLWLTRLFLMLITTIVGKRRSWQGEEENSWCLNLWLEENKLKIDCKRRNIYTAFEVAQAELLYEVDGVGRKFFAQNLWIKNFLPNIKFKVNEKMNEVSYLSSFLAGVDLMVSLFFDLLNYLSFLFQCWYMKPHKTREEVGFHKAFFHPRDTKRQVANRWIRSLKSLK